MIEKEAKIEQVEAEAENTRSPWVVLAVLSVGVVLAALDLTVVVAILTTIMDDLNVTLDNIDQGAWIVSAYLLAYTVTMPFMGRVSDVFGRRWVFLGALAVFMLGSLLGALSNTLPMMIAARSLQALGGGAMVPVSMAVVGDIFPAKRRGLALGVLGAADTAGWVIGPLYGSLMLKYFNWHSVFWVNIPLGLISAVIIFFALRPRTNKSTKKKERFRFSLLRQIDFLGFFLLTIALTCLTLALGGKDSAALSGASLDELTKNPLKEYQIPLLIAAGIALFLFIFVEFRVTKPLLNLRTFSRISYSAANFANLIIGGALIAGLVGVALFVNSRAENTATAIDIAFDSALALAPLTLGMALGAFVGGWFSDRVGYRIVTVVGMLLVSGGFLLMSQWNVRWIVPADLPGLLPAATIAGLGFGLVIAPVGSAVIEWADREDIGVAAALVLIMRLVGMTVGTAIVTTWVLNRYDQLKPKDIKITEIKPEDLTIPLAQTVTEVFFWAAILAAIAILPALLLARRQISAADEATRHEVGRLL
jgi:EmrB/QacA subfamily drug resistance transporter